MLQLPQLAAYVVYDLFVLADPPVQFALAALVLLVVAALVLLAVAALVLLVVAAVFAAVFVVL